MFRENLGAILAATTIIGASFNVNAATTLFDGFESATLSAPTSPSPAINSGGFRWGGTNYTTVVGMLNGLATKVWGATGSMNQINTGFDWTCKSGTYCLRFNYSAGANMSEQRFSLGSHYPELWMSYWIKVPSNYTHGNLNNKWLALWTNVYDGPGDLTWQTRPNGAGGANLVLQDGGTAQPESLSKPFINVPGDRGRWMKIVIRAKPATASGANNGIVQLYRRWANEASYTKIHEKLNARFYEGGQGIHQGYLMGWVNDPYKVNTEWLLDDFTVSNTSLLETSTNAPTSSPPSAPVLRIQ